MTSYAIAAGLFAAAGIFLIAACLVGTGPVSLDRDPLRTILGFGTIGALLDDCCNLCRRGRGQIATAASPHFPTLTSRARVAIKSNPLSRTRSKPREIPPRPRSCCAPSAPPPTRARRPAGNNRNIQARPARDRDAAGLGGHAAAANGAPDGRLTPRPRDKGDNLFLMAATAILPCAAHHFFQAVSAHAYLRVWPPRSAGSLPHEYECAIGQPCPRSVFARTGKRSKGASTSAPMTIVCLPPPQASCSSGCLRYFRP